MKKIKIIVTLIAFTFMANSCLVDDNVNDSSFSGSPYVVGFKNTFSSYIYTSLDTEKVTIVEPIDLVGGNNGLPANYDLAIRFEVDPSSTAIAGENYTLLNSTGVATIAANSDFVNFPIELNPETLPDNQPKLLKINLIEVTSPNGVVAENRKSINITIAKCASELEGVYSLVVTRTDIDNSPVVNFPNEVITKIGFNEYLTSTTASYSLSGLQADYPDITRAGFTFKDVCQSIQVDEQNLADYFSNLVYGNSVNGSFGNVNLNDDGEVVSFTINYTVTFAAGNRNYTGVYTKL